MAVKLRLTRMGAKKSPFYRIVAMDSRKSRDGQYIEQIGYYNPVKNPAEIKIDKEIALKWLKTGAQPTDTVRNIFYKAGIIQDSKKHVIAEKQEVQVESVDNVKETLEAAVKSHVVE